MVECACNPSILEVEVGGSVVQGQPRLCKTRSQENKIKQNGTQVSPEADPHSNLDSRAMSWSFLLARAFLGTLWEGKGKGRRGEEG